MNICNLNLNNIKINKLNFAHQNPITFRGTCESDSFELSDEAKAQKCIKKLKEKEKSLNEEISAIQARKEEIALDVETLWYLMGKKSIFNDDELDSIWQSAKKRKQNGVDPLANKLTEILAQKTQGMNLSNETMLQFSAQLKKELKSMSTLFDFDRKHVDLIKRVIAQVLKDIQSEDKISDIKLRERKISIETLEKQISNIEYFPNFAVLYDDEYEKVRGGQKIKLAKELGCVIDFDSKQYSNFSPGAKQAIKSILERLQVEYASLPINSKANQETLAQFDGYKVFTQDELREIAKKDLEEVFPCARIENIASKKLILFDCEDERTKAIEDLMADKVFSIEKLSDIVYFDTTALPFVYEKYDTKDENAKINFTFINPDNEFNARVLNSGAKYGNFLSCVPFLYDKKPWGAVLDLDNQENLELLKNTYPLYPKQSPYFYGELGGEKAKKIDIPVEYLEKLGFCRANILIDLINNKKLDGKKNEQGDFVVTIDTKDYIGKNKNLNILQKLREQNPRIKTFSEVAKALRIKQERLDWAIFCGDFEIIDEYINAADRQIRYIDVTTLKNQEFIRKVKFEQELESQLKEAQREQNKKARIENKDLNAKLQSLRIALVWEFMPNTKAIASKLASSDGLIAKLLAKEDDPDEKLTQIEERKINAYRKEVWTQAGVEELQQAHKKVNGIMKAFKEKGLIAVDESLHPIFERYGFV